MAEIFKIANNKILVNKSKQIPLEIDNIEDLPATDDGNTYKIGANWYYWNGAMWVDGGVYQDNDIKTCLDDLDEKTSTLDYYFNASLFTYGDYSSSGIITSMNWRIVFEDMLLATRDYILNVKSGYQFSVYKFNEDGSYIANSWSGWKGTGYSVTISKGTYFRVEIKLATENNSPKADINTYCKQVTFNSVDTLEKKDITIRLDNIETLINNELLVTLNDFQIGKSPTDDGTSLSTNAKRATSPYNNFEGYGRIKFLMDDTLKFYIYKCKNNTKVSGVAWSTSGYVLEVESGYTYTICVGLVAETTITSEELTSILALAKDKSTGLNMPTENNEADNVSERVLALQNRNTLSFAFLTDLHLDLTNADHKQAYDKTCISISNICRKANLGGVFFGGDNTSNVSNLTNQKLCTSYVRDNMSSYVNKPILIAKGNHDDNSILGRVSSTSPSICKSTYFLNDNELYKRYDKQNDNSNVVLGNDGLYGYIDYKSQKTRVFMLNSIDIPYGLDSENNLSYAGQWVYAYRNAQLNFVAENLVFNENGWSVVVISHIGISTNSDYQDYSVKNNDVLVNILKAFKNGTSYVASGGETDFEYNINCNFTHSGNVIANIAGHNHLDLNTTYEGINCILTKKAAYGVNSNSSTPNLTNGVDYTAFDIFTIDTVEKKIYSTRYGLGSDREFTYS